MKKRSIDLDPQNAGADFRGAASIQSLWYKMGLKNFVGESPAFLAAIGRIPSFARCGANVLVAGETVTGKEICAWAIHHLSPRLKQPFVAVNCGAIPPELLENELFGHAPGAFTSANRPTPGLIRERTEALCFSTRSTLCRCRRR